MTTDFQLGFEKEVCIDTTQIILPQSHFEFWNYDFYYPENGCPTKISSSLSYLDGRYVFLSSQNFKNLLLTNNLEQYSQIYNLNISKFFQDEKEEFNVDIMFRPRIHFNKECLIPNGTPATSLFTLLQGSDASKTLTAISVSFVMMLLGTILGCTGIIFKNFCSKKRSKRTLMMWVLSGIMVMFALTLVPIFTLLHRVNQVDHSFFEEKLEEGIVCGDRYVHAIVDGVISSYSKTRAITSALIFFVILACVAWIVFVVFKSISSENEYQFKTKSDRETSSQGVFYVGGMTENERYTNQKEGSTRENALVSNQKDESDEWEDNRVASYIPQKIYIDEEGVNSFSEEMPFKPHVQSRMLGVSQTISKKRENEEDSDEEYYRRKHRRKRKNKGLQKRLGKNKGFEMVGRDFKDTSKEGKSIMDDQDYDNQIRTDVKRYDTITIMSPNLSMEGETNEVKESTIISKKVNHPGIGEVEDLNKSGIVFVEKSKIEDEPLKFKDNQIKRTPVRNKRKVKDNLEKKSEKKRIQKSINLLSSNTSKPKRTKVETKKENQKETVSRKSRNANKIGVSNLMLSKVSRKARQPKEIRFDVSEEPSNITQINKKNPRKNRPQSKSKEDAFESKPLRKSRKSRYEKSVYSSNGSSQDNGLIFGNKSLGKKPRERTKKNDIRVSRKSRNTKKEGSLFSGQN